MLARAHRVITAAEFRAVVRRGRKVATPTAVYYRLVSSDSPARFGFVISRAVGDAVARNLLRRRMRAVAAELVSNGVAGVDIVVRALPGAAEVPWTRLREEMLTALTSRPVAA